MVFIATPVDPSVGAVENSCGAIVSAVVKPSVTGSLIPAYGLPAVSITAVEATVR